MAFDKGIPLGDLNASYTPQPGALINEGLWFEKQGQNVPFSAQSPHMHFQLVNLQKALIGCANDVEI
jgi:hypothetical protein